MRNPRRRNCAALTTYPSELIIAGSGKFARRFDAPPARGLRNLGLANEPEDIEAAIRLVRSGAVVEAAGRELIPTLAGDGP